MSTNNNVVKKPLTGLFTVLALLLFLGGFYLPGSEFLASKAWYLRLLVVIVSVLMSVFSLMLTVHWQRLISLARGAKIEVRKVFWPHKDEWVKTTLMVLLMVAIFAIFLSIVDAILNFIVHLVL